MTLVPEIRASGRGWEWRVREPAATPHDRRFRVVAKGWCPLRSSAEVTARAAADKEQQRQRDTGWRVVA